MDRYTINRAITKLSRSALDDAENGAHAKPHGISAISAQNPHRYDDYNVEVRLDGAP